MKKNKKKLVLDSSKSRDGYIIKNPMIHATEVKAAILKESSIVRDNIMNRKGYSPYCGNNESRWLRNGCDNPRTKFNGKQFVCPKCGWKSQFPTDFIERYKTKWQITNSKP